MDRKNKGKRQPGEKRSYILEVAAHAAAVYLAMFFLGTAGEYFYGTGFVSGGFAIFIGIFLLIMSPLFILWSQESIRSFRKGVVEGLHIPSFNIGPYRFTRNPTYLGLALLIGGFGFLANSLYIVLSAIIGFLIVNFLILPKEERLLEEKYGDSYLSYKKKVSRWL